MIAIATACLVFSGALLGGLAGALAGLAAGLILWAESS